MFSFVHLACNQEKKSELCDLRKIQVYHRTFFLSFRRRCKSKQKKANIFEFKL